MATLSSGATGVPASRKYPSVYTKVVFGASPNSAGGAVKTILVLANKTSAGTATVDTLIGGPFTPTTATTFYGTGSEGALGVTAACAMEPAATIYGIAVTVSGGAVGTVTLTVANAATGDGGLTLKIHGVTIVASILSGQSAITQATNIVAAINSKGAFLNCTAANGGGASAVVTITARHAGTRGNLITVFSTPDSSITGSTYTLNNPTITGGTLADDITTALASAGARKFDYYALAQVDTANLQLLQTKLLSNAGPLVRKRSQAIAMSGMASPVVYASLNQTVATTQAVLLNEPLLQLLWFKSFEFLPIQLAAGWAARRAVRESDNPNYHFSLLNPTAVDLSTIIGPPSSEANYMLESEANSALDNGITPVIIRNSDTHPMVCLSITSHSQDSSGNPDTRTLTTNYVSVPFAWADEVETFVPTSFPGMSLRDEPVDGDDPLPPNITTPNTIKGYLVDDYKRRFDLTGFIKGFDADVANWQFNLDANNANRVDATMQVTPAPWFTQFSSNILQTSP